MKDRLSITLLGGSYSCMGWYARFNKGIIMDQIHIVECLKKDLPAFAGNIRRSKSRTLAAVVATGASAARTAVISRPLEDDDYYTVNVLCLHPRGVEAESAFGGYDEYRPRSWAALKRFVTSFLEGGDDEALCRASS